MPTLTAARAALHESLYPRLAALEKQITPIAARKPELGLPPGVFRAARQVLAEVQGLLGRRQRVMGLQRGAVDYATLGVALAAARAALEGFEAEHSAWNQEQKCRCWQLADGDPLPVRRLLPGGVPPKAAGSAETRDIKEKLIRRMMASRKQAYWDGYADAEKGLPADDSRYDR
jgi:hypothetical protein